MIFPVSHQQSTRADCQRRVYSRDHYKQTSSFCQRCRENQGRIAFSLAIDVGAVSAQDLKENFQIRMAAPVVPDVTCTYDETHDLFIGKAFDCRIGCAALIETLNQLSTEMLDVDVEATLTVQEEGGRKRLYGCCR